MADRRIRNDAPSWSRDGGDWPNRESSRFVRAAGLGWHVQQSGHGPDLLLLHGSGGATHSWRTLAPVLAEQFTVIAPDLPGHGFTEAPVGRGYALPALADAVARLLGVLGRRPTIVVGHSAGAAIACRMCLDGAIAPDRVVSLGGALGPLGGWTGPFWTRMARPLTWSPLVARLLARRGRRPEVVERLLRGTGSRIDREGVRLYGRLFRSPHHVASVLRMMASWDLRPLLRDLPALEPGLLLVAGERDRYVPVSQAEQVRERVPHAELVVLPELGHLAHEERPDVVASLIDPRLASRRPPATPARRAVEGRPATDGVDA